MVTIDRVEVDEDLLERYYETFLRCQITEVSWATLAFNNRMMMLHRQICERAGIEYRWGSEFEKALYKYCWARCEKDPEYIAWHKLALEEFDSEVLSKLKEAPFETPPASQKRQEKGP